MSASDVVVGRTTRRIRQCRELPGVWQVIFEQDVRWLPGHLPDSDRAAPPHDGYYEVQEGSRIFRFAYPALAAGHMYDRRMTADIARGRTVDDALRDTDGW
jgi:hypothetical protein